MRIGPELAIMKSVWSFVNSMFCFLFAKIDDNYVIIDGIKVQYDKYTEGFLKKLVIDYKNNMIEFGDEGNE